ncbi:MAG: metallophosphoesterase [Nitrospiraceae bacterium]|nr:metallophosphoesterase [Nitrospiraceae bacterium]
MPSRFFLFVSAIQVIILLGHLLLYRTTVRFLGISNPSTLGMLKAALIFLSVTFIASSLLAFRYSNLFTRIYYTFSAAWMGFFYFLFGASILLWVIYSFQSVFPVHFNQKALFLSFYGIAFLTAVYGIVNADTIRITHVTVKLPGLPGQWKGKTAAWTSDVHLGQIRGYGEAAAISGMIQKLKPDIIFIGGDLYDGVAANADELVRPFSKLRAPYGVFFITGNHEEFSSAAKAKYVKAVEGAGIRVLNNEVINIGGLQIAGVDYRDTASRKRFRTILDGMNIDHNRPVILLKHSPLNIGTTANAGITLQISGHTHKGQIFPINFLTAAIYRGFDYGLKSLGKTQVYTSSGAGTWGPPLRVGTIPEVVEFRLE